jgi:hypothetical protein
MPGDVSRSGVSRGAMPPRVADCARLGERLARTPRAERDLAWYVMAEHVGDLTALASARLRTIEAPSDVVERWDRPDVAGVTGDWDHPRAPGRWLPGRRGPRGAA